MKCREAQNNGLGVLSTGEALLAALVLNRADWLAKMGYTIAEALDRVDTDAIALVPTAARMIAEANSVMGRAQSGAREEAALTDLSSESAYGDVNAKLVTYGNAPGYRDVSLIFDMQRFESPKVHRVRLHVNTEDSLSILRHIVDVNRVAWDGGKPIDGKTEERPLWLERLYPAP